MSLDNFSPELWAGRILSNLNKRHVYAELCNRDYEGDIKAAGDTVRINSIGRITVSDYVKNTALGTPDFLDSSQQVLLIDQAKSYYFLVDDIDAAQNKPSVMNEAMREAAYALNQTVDTYLAGLMATNGLTQLEDASGNPIVPTATTAYEYLVDLAVALDENDVPEDGRSVVVPPWYYGLLLKDDRFVTYDKVPDALTNGVVGSAAGFTIRKSNNVPNTNGTAYKVIASHKIGTSFAEQLIKTEAFRPDDYFGDAVRGLHVYGAKVVRPEAIAVMTVSES